MEFHTFCVSSSVPRPTTLSPPTDGYDWFCPACVEAHQLVGSLFRLLVPLAQTDNTEPGDIVSTTVNVLTTADDPRHPAEADTTPPIPDTPPDGNPARSSVEDATAGTVPIYLATKPASNAPAKWRYFYLYMRRHYVGECLARTPTTLADAVRHHSTAPRHALFHLFRPLGALTQDEPVGVFDTHGAVEQYDSDTQRCAADASADRWYVATARVRDIDTAHRHCASALDGVASDISQPQRVAAVCEAISGAMRAAQPNKPPRRAFAESTVPKHAIPLPPARLGPLDDHIVLVPLPTARPSEWCEWAQSVRDLRPAWAAAQTDSAEHEVNIIDISVRYRLLPPRPEGVTNNKPTGLSALVGCFIAAGVLPTRKFPCMFHPGGVMVDRDHPRRHLDVARAPPRDGRARAPLAAVEESFLAPRPAEEDQ